MQLLATTKHMIFALLLTAWLAFALPAQSGQGSPPTGHAVSEEAAPAVSEVSPPQDPQGASSTADKPKDGKKADKKKKRPKKPGIPVEDELIHTLCGTCHQLDDRKHMTRISYLRKSPEGWSRSVKRMGRLHGLQLTPTTAKMVVRSLANSHGLARKEAERGLYDSERRVHWSEDHHSADFKRACAQCHPLGRALLQHRDKDEWQLLRATHVAMFPLSRGQMGGGPPRESSGRFSFRGGSSSSSGRGGNSSSSRGSSSSSSNSSSNTRSSNSSSSNRRSSSSGVGDRVLDQLSKDQPLFTPEWEAWTHNKREVPLEGVWSVHGHETGRGDVVGMVRLTRTDTDEYGVQWDLRWSDGTSEQRTGRGVLYAGYSWRGRSASASPPPKDPATESKTTWREVLLLDDTWQSFRGRIFSGAYDELGMDVTLSKDTKSPRIVALGNASLPIPTKSHKLDIYGESFGENVRADQFHVGQGLTITDIERKSDRHVVLTVDAAAGTKLGTRTVAFGPHPGVHKVTLYDTVDYVRIRPLQGLSRNGGAKHPRQYERFEAYAMHRGNDGKPYTDDDIDLFQVRGSWGLQEFAVRDDDDDLKYVGSIDPNSGVFTPNLDGPNPERKWQTNNFGDVFVTFEATLDIPVRPPEKKIDKDEDEGEADEESSMEDNQGGGAEVDNQDSTTQHNSSKEAEATPAVIVREQKKFFARSHLTVTVPIYVRWQVLDWEDR